MLCYATCTYNTIYSMEIPNPAAYLVESEAFAGQKLSNGSFTHARSSRRTAPVLNAKAPLVRHWPSTRRHEPRARDTCVHEEELRWPVRRWMFQMGRARGSSSPNQSPISPPLFSSRKACCSFRTEQTLALKSELKGSELQGTRAETRLRWRRRFL